MTKNFFNLFYLLLIFVAALAVFAGSPDTNNYPLRFGTNVWIGNEFYHAARSLGFLNPNETRLLEYTSASGIIRSMRNGTLQAAALTLDEAIRVADAGIPIKIVQIIDFSEGGDALVSRNDLPDVAALKGRRVGVETGGVGRYLLSRALETAGLAPNEVTIIDLAINEHESGFRSGLVDAVVTFDPVLSRLKEAGGREIFSSRSLPGEIVDVLVVRADYLAAHEDVVCDLAGAWFKAKTRLAQDPETMLPLLNTRLKLTAPGGVAGLLDEVFLPDREGNLALIRDPRAPLRLAVRRMHDFLHPAPAGGDADRLETPESLLDALPRIMERIHD